MIRCKICRKFAKLTKVKKNGLEQLKVYGSCKFCGYKNKQKIDYDDYEDLGIKD